MYGTLSFLNKTAKLASKLRMKYGERYETGAELVSGYFPDVPHCHY
jgi:hypothetical protein